MTSRIQEMLAGRDDVIDYAAVINKYPWLVQKDQNCILSPDSDGLLCGLFTSHYLNWKIRGFYDGKILVLEKEFNPKDCIFLDMEIFRKEIKSVGQHMIMFNKDRLPGNWNNFDDCFSANNIRGYDAKHNFPQKYPLATIHLLLGFLGSIKKIEIPTTAICPLLYTDGTFKNLFNYPDNCLSWLLFLRADIMMSPLHAIFFNDHYSISSLMMALRDFFDELRVIAHGRRGADKIKFSNTKGGLTNLDRKTNGFNLQTRGQAENFITLLSQKTGWDYKVDDWTWNKFKITNFRKGNIKPSQGRYEDIMKKNPLSLAVTSG